MKLLTETYTPLIKNLQDLNQEIRLRLSSMPSCTEQEMRSLGPWLEEVRKMVQDLDNHSSIIYHHLEILKEEYQQRLKKDSLKV